MPYPACVHPSTHSPIHRQKTTYPFGSRWTAGGLAVVATFKGSCSPGTANSLACATEKKENRHQKISKPVRQRFFAPLLEAILFRGGGTKLRVQCCICSKSTSHLFSTSSQRNLPIHDLHTAPPVQPVEPFYPCSITVPPDSHPTLLASRSCAYS